MGLIQTLFGGPTPPLKPRGPAPFTQPPERDRQALFWWLKRNTSYTALAHNAVLWSEFVAEWERWLRSQDDPYEHLIETLKYALDTQLYYERGLNRLKQGDHSVFNRQSSEGWLEKVNTGLPGRRMEWYGTCELIAEQDGVPLSMLLAYEKAHDAAMAVGHGMSYFSLDNHKNTARQLLASLGFDTSVPEPRWDISFRPNKSAPKDGIYEQVDSEGHVVGGMGYFVKGQQSNGDVGLEFGPDAWETTQQTTSDFLWRLLWEDTRYKDGVIPDEERLYPLPTESARLAKDQVSPSPAPIRLRCEAGQPCPADGEWSTPAAQGSRHFKRGEIMPEMQADYGQTIWYCEQEVS